MREIDCFCFVRPIAVLAFATAITPPISAFAQSAVQAPEANPDIKQVNQTVIMQPSPPTPEEVGDSLMMHQRYQAAIESYKKVKTSSADVWNKMGIAYQMMFDQADATRCYQATLKIDPKNTSVLNNLGTIYDSAKQYGAAEKMYRKALKIDSKSAIAQKNLGTNLLAQHKYKKGWEAYQTALVIDPHIFENNSSPRIDNPSSPQNRGAMNYFMAKGCVRAGMNERAIDYLRMALNEGFTNPKKIIEDGEFASLRGRPAFEQLLAAQNTP
jgi:tetratricopeptide (TPR) repeat protein